jgi:hypothetical protein
VAKLPTLIAKLAQLDGRSMETLAHVARVIRERGLMTTTKRGAGAAEMTVRDATNLLIALNGAQVPKDAPDAVEHYRSFYRSYPPEGRPGHPELEYQAFNANWFGDALEKLIESIPLLVETVRARHNHFYMNEREGNYDDANAADFLHALRSADCGVEIRFEKTYATIAVYDKDESDDRRNYILSSFALNRRRSHGSYQKQWADREVIVSVGLLTLMAIWFALHPNERIGTISESSREWTINIRP